MSNFQIEHTCSGSCSSTRTSGGQPDRGAPVLHQRRLPRYSAEHGIATKRSPIAQAKAPGDPEVRRIAEATGRTPAQVVLRWHIQRGDIVFPKSVTPQRVRENFALFDFELTDSDIDALTALDKGEAGRTGPNPDRFDYIRASSC